MKKGKLMLKGSKIYLVTAVFVVWTLFSLVSAQKVVTLAIGSNGDGQLGNGKGGASSSFSARFVDFSEDIINASVGDGHTLLLTNNGTVFSYGIGWSGQLGNNKLSSDFPSQIIYTGPKITQISAGPFFSLISSSNGTGYSFGNNDHGNLGINSTIEQSIPVLMAFNHIIQKISAGGEHSMVLTDNGTVYTCGLGEDGQLGNGFTSNLEILSPITYNGSKIVEISAGYYHSMILSVNGEVFLFGKGSDHQLGSLNVLNQLVPTQLSIHEKISEVAAGGTFSMVLSTSGIVYTFGKGYLGNDDAFIKESPTKIDFNEKVVKISAGFSQALILTADGIPYRFGVYPQVEALPEQEPTFKPTKVTIAEKVKLDERKIINIHAGKSYSLMMTKSLKFLTVGIGSLGINFQKSSSTPSQVFSDILVKQVSCGGWHTLILLTNGSVLATGYGLMGQLGTKEKSLRVPTLVATNNQRITDVSAGSRHSLIVDENGDVHSFGEGLTGQLGLGSVDYQYFPALIGSLKYIRRCSAGGGHSLVLSNSGIVHSFGYNRYGQLGIGSDNETVREPTLIQYDATPIVEISAGDWHSLILTDQGVVYSFGSNSYGQLGLGEQVWSVPVPTITKWNQTKIKKISAGYHHSLILDENGIVYSFGSGDKGELGTGEQKSSNIPIPIQYSGSKIKQIGTGYEYSMILSEDGTVLSFGLGDGGRLGSNGTNKILIPTPIKYNESVSSIAVGYHHSFIISTNLICDGIPFYEEESVCNSRGRCTQPDNCTCVSSYSGLNCEFVAVKNGRCKTPDVCECNSPYTGVSCESCISGYYNKDGNCEPCPLNTYKTGSDSNICIYCPSHVYSNITGSASNETCLPCADGYYRLNSTSTCVQCPPGTYQKNPMTNCSFCPKSTWNPHFNATTCLSCEQDNHCMVGTAKLLNKPYENKELYKDPRDGVSVSAKQKETDAVKYVTLIVYAALAILILLVIYFLVFLCTRSFKGVDFFFSQAHAYGEGEVIKVRSTTLGGILSGIAIVTIIGLAVLSFTKFIFSNTIESTSFVFNEKGSLKPPTERMLFKIKSFGLNSQMKCNETTMSSTGINFVGSSKFTTNGNDECIVEQVCDKCELIGLDQRICFHMKAPSNLIQYELNVASVVKQGDGSRVPYNMSGTIVAPNGTMYSGETDLIVTLFIAQYQQLLWGYFHFILNIVLGSFISIPPDETIGFSGYVAGTNISSSEKFESGYSICYKTNISPLIYQIKETSITTGLNLFAQIGALYTTSITVFSFILRSIEKYVVKNYHKIKKKITKEAEDIELPDTTPKTRKRNANVKVESGHQGKLKNAVAELFQ